MAELKTKATRASVAGFLAAVKDPGRRRDAETVSRLMRRLTGKAPRLWGPSIVGFGDRTLVYPNGRELPWFQVGFSPRKEALVLYLGLGDRRSDALLAKLGPHKRGKSCLYLKTLEGVAPKVLEALVKASIAKA